MNTHSKIARLFAVAMAAALLSVGSAFAQSIREAGGSFTLPFEAHWGAATLPAGRYTLAVSRSAAGNEMVRVDGQAKGSRHAFIMVQGYDPSPSANQSQLACIRHGNTGRVLALVLSSINETLYFSLPKNEPLYVQNRSGKSRALLAQGPESIDRIPVEAAGM